MDLDFRDKLVSIMERNNLSFEEVSDAVDVPVSTVVRWVEGKNRPYHSFNEFIFDKLETLARK